VLTIPRFNSRQNETGTIGRPLKASSIKKRLLRYLKSLVRDGFLVKKGKQYFLNESADEYRLFSYIDHLRQRYSRRGLSSEFGVGNILGGLCVGTMIPMPLLESLRPDESFALKTIGTVLAELFVALKDLRDSILFRRAGMDISLSDATLRWALLAALAWELDEFSHETTPDLFEELKPMLRYSGSSVQQYISKNKDDRSLVLDPMFESLMDHLHGSGQLDTTELLAHIARKKQLLRDMHDLDADKISTSEALRMLEDDKRKLQDAATQYLKEHMNNEGTEIVSYYYTPEESEYHSALQTLVSIKVAEYLASADVDWEDFAVTMTPDPDTMNRFHTPATVLRNEVQMWK
jgi:hypothetical protein